MVSEHDVQFDMNGLMSLWSCGVIIN